MKNLVKIKNKKLRTSFIPVSRTQELPRFWGVGIHKERKVGKEPSGDKLVVDTRCLQLIEDPGSFLVVDVTDTVSWDTKKHRTPVPYTGRTTVPTPNNTSSHSRWRFMVLVRGFWNRRRPIEPYPLTEPGQRLGQGTVGGQWEDEGRLPPTTTNTSGSRLSREVMTMMDVTLSLQIAVTTGGPLRELVIGKEKTTITIPTRLLIQLTSCLLS